MTDIIDFLERVGRDPDLRDHGDNLAVALEKVDMQAPQRAAILAGDAEALRALQGKGTLFALQMPSEEQPDHEHEFV